MLRRTTAATALVAGVVAAGCGGDASDLFSEGGDVDGPAGDGGVTETVPADAVDPGLFDDDDLMAESEVLEPPAWDGPNDLSLDFDEYRAVVEEIFDGNDTGRGTSNMWPAPTANVEVRAGSMSEAEILVACEALTDWLFDRPEDEAVGPVILEIGERESGADMSSTSTIAANTELIPREQRGGCETL